MPITADFHLHTSHSADSETPMEEMILRGISLGFKELCFTEHLDYDYPIYPDVPEGTFILDADSYESEFLQLKDKYQSQISLHFGLECGMQPKCLAKNIQFVHQKSYEFILGSQHLCNGLDPYYPDFFAQHDGSSSLRTYFEDTLKNIILFPDFDVLAHIDYMVRYCESMNRTYCYIAYKDILDAILEHLVLHHKGLELNTGGLRRGMKETNPGLSVLKRFHEIGGQYVTIGSDAHHAADLGAAFNSAESVLKAAGFSYYTVFRNRQPILLPY